MGAKSTHEDWVCTSLSDLSRRQFTEKGRRAGGAEVGLVGGERHMQVLGFRRVRDSEGFRV